MYKNIDGFDKEYKINDSGEIFCDNKIVKAVIYAKTKGNSEYIDTVADTEADVRAKILIRLIEDKLIIYGQK